MVNLSIALPDKMKDYVDAQVETAEYIDGSDFVRDLIRRDQERRIQELKQFVDRVACERPHPMTMDDIHREAVEITKGRGTFRE